jgi:ribosome-binding protein aMBF1 (putative translation factor)
MTGHYSFGGSMTCEVCGREECGRERERMIGGDTMEAEECYRLGYEREKAARIAAEKQLALFDPAAIAAYADDRVRQRDEEWRAAWAYENRIHTYTVDAPCCAPLRALLAGKTP